jgi:quercetin dioxygenase-like cupin family protein
MPGRKKSKDLSLGEKIGKARREKKITLEQVANDTGCSTDYLKKVESGEVTPPVGTMLQISRALQIDSGMLLKADADAAKDRIKAYQKRTENYAYTTLTPGAEKKHLKAFRVSVDSLQEHKGVGYQHEGEEFVYVLVGEIEVTVGDHVNRLGQGDSLHFNSGVRHKLRNTSKTAAELLVIVYAP